MKRPFAFAFVLALAGLALALGGCSSVEQDVAPEPSPAARTGSGVPIDQTAPINGGALYNGN